VLGASPSARRNLKWLGSLGGDFQIEHVRKNLIRSSLVAELQKHRKRECHHRATHPDIFRPKARQSHPGYLKEALQSVAITNLQEEFPAGGYRPTMSPHRTAPSPCPQERFRARLLGHRQRIESTAHQKTGRFGRRISRNLPRSQPRQQRRKTGPRGWRDVQFAIASSKYGTIVSSIEMASFSGGQTSRERILSRKSFQI